MTTAPPAAPVPAARPRLLSLDAFRGLVILTMIFVNFLAGVTNIPWWAKHMPGRADGYTFVDLVFPGFLFIVGVSIPLALEKRRQRGDAAWQVVGRVFARAASLLFIGVILVNTEAFSAEATGLREDVWFFLACFSVAVLWSSMAAGRGTVVPRWLLVLKGLALVGLGYALVVFRGKGEAGQAVWLQHSWWGILGLIGWAYLNSSLLYLVTRGDRAALMGLMGFLLCMYIGGRYGRLDWLGPVNSLVGVGDVLGSTSANVLAGVIVGTWFVGEAAARPASQRMRFMGLFGLGLYLAGMLLRPLHGIVKNQATAAYTLVAAGLCCLMFLAFYWVIDVRQRQGWCRFLLPAGENPLLAYLIPDILIWGFGAVSLGQLLWPWNSGAMGALNAAVLTAAVLLLNWALTRSGVRLRM